MQVLPLYTMRLFNWTPTQAGLLFITLSLSLLPDPYIGAVTDKLGSRFLSVAGLSACTVVYLGSISVTEDSILFKTTLCVLLVCMGFAIGAISTSNTVEISHLVAAEEKKNLGIFQESDVTGQAHALNDISNGIGSLFGPAWGGAVMPTQGWRLMCFSFF